MSVLVCLALNIYFEARSENFRAQLAIAHVVENRVMSSQFPNSYCDVVFDGGERRHMCQFSWYCDGKSDTPRDLKAWKTALRVAGSYWKYPDPTAGALWYHADYVQPRWAGRNYISIGSHKFYHALYD
jgi:spore germination cell wall hydrolase CwlJ-like protein